MSPLLQYGSVGSGTIGAFLVAVAVVVGIPIAVLLVGKLFDRFF